MKLPKIACLVWFSVFALLGAKAQSPHYVLDFVENENSLSTFKNAGIELIEINGLRYQRDLPSGLYSVKVPNNNLYILNVDGGTINLELDNSELISSLELKTGRLNVRQAEVLGKLFHQFHDLDETQMNAWIEGIKNQTEMDFYSKGITSNYPAIVFQFYKTFYPPEPISAKLYFEWDEKLTRRRGVDLKKNENLNVNYNAPEILASLPTERVAESSSALVPEVAEVAQETSASEPATEQPAKVDMPESSEEPAEQSSNWWLWLIGLLVVVGGLALVVRRKS